MKRSGKLKDKTLFITGASRGIGLAIALKAAQDGANIIIAAKTIKTHPKLPGTIYTAAKQIENLGGKALPCVVDVRNEDQVKYAVRKAVATFGGIDIVVNNASAISLMNVKDVDMKKYRLMNDVNARGTFLVSQECLPYLKKSPFSHILNMSPPLIMHPLCFASHTAYTIAKYGMSMCTLGMSEELKDFGIGVNSLWPKTLIDTAAAHMLGSKEISSFCRKPDIVADAAYAILTSDPKEVTGNFFVDEDILREKGVTDFDQYCVNVEYKDQIIKDFYLDKYIKDIVVYESKL